MIEQADVFVKNFFDTAVQVSRKLPDGSTGLSISIAAGEEEKVLLPGTDESLIIQAPAGIDITEQFIKAKAQVDLSILYSRTDSLWKINIVPNDLDPEVPTTVNVNIGEDE